MAGRDQTTTSGELVYAHGMLVRTHLSDDAHQRYEHALWYAWGRDDAGDTTLRDLPKAHPIGNAFGFAEFAASEAEHFARGYVCLLRPIHDQYQRYVTALGAGS